MGNDAVPSRATILRVIGKKSKVDRRHLLGASCQILVAKLAYILVPRLQGADHLDPTDYWKPSQISRKHNALDK